MFSDISCIFFSVCCCLLFTCVAITLVKACNVCIYIIVTIDLKGKRTPLHFLQTMNMFSNTYSIGLAWCMVYMLSILVVKLNEWNEMNFTKKCCFQIDSNCFVAKKNTWERTSSHARICMHCKHSHTYTWLRIIFSQTMINGVKICLLFATKSPKCLDIINHLDLFVLL